MRQQYTHTHTHTFYMRSVFSCCERGECRKKRRAALLRLLAAFLLSERWPTFMPGKKKGLVQQTVRICEGWEEMEGSRKVKAKNERNRDGIQEEIDRAEQESRSLLWCYE